MSTRLAVLPMELIQQTQSATDCNQLGAALHTLRAATAAPGAHPGQSDLCADLKSGLPGLHSALSEFPEPFFGADGLLSYIVAACQPDVDIELPLLVMRPEADWEPSSVNSSVVITAVASLSRRDVQTILARMFLCALPELVSTGGRLSCATLLGCPMHGAISTAAEKLKCFLGYFCAMRAAPDYWGAEIRFVRARSAAAKCWSAAMAEQPLADCSFEWGFEMQESRDAAVTDFANEQFGYGLIPSCTQEEMLMCARPEALAGCAIAPVMQAQEVVLVVGARHMVHCTKPSSAEKFRYTGLCEEDQDPAIMIGVDAFKALLELPVEAKTETQIRDINKLIVGFCHCSVTVLSLCPHLCRICIHRITICCCLYSRYAINTTSRSLLLLRPLL